MIGQRLLLPSGGWGEVVVWERRVKHWSKLGLCRDLRTEEWYPDASSHIGVGRCPTRSCSLENPNTTPADLLGPCPSGRRESEVSGGVGFVEFVRLVWGAC